MKKPSDKLLGMQRAITRRDFVQGAAVAAGAALQAGALGFSGVTNATAAGSAGAQRMTIADYPPVKTGMRGSHPGAYEIAHALARDGAKFPEPKSTEEHYDLIVVGAGISGLAAAHYYQKRFGADSKILLLENHDDFGGHAKRNEHTINGQRLISYGGSQTLVEPRQASPIILELFKDIGVDLKRFDSAFDRDFFQRHGLGPVTYFDKQQFGRDAVVQHPFCYY